MKLSPAVYDTGQWVVRVFLPAFITFYITTDQFVDLPAEEAVAGISGGLAVFLGALLAKSSSDFKKENLADAGFLQQTGVDPDTGIPDLGLTLTRLPQELLGKKTITLKVDNPHPAQQPPAPE